MRAFSLSVGLAVVLVFAAHGNEKERTENCRKTAQENEDVKHCFSDCEGATRARLLDQCNTQADNDTNADRNCAGKSDNDLENCRHLQNDIRHDKHKSCSGRYGAEQCRPSCSGREDEVARQCERDSAIREGGAVATFAAGSVDEPQTSGLTAIEITKWYGKYKSSEKLLDAYLRGVAHGFGLGVQGRPAHIPLTSQQMTEEAAGVNGLNVGYLHGLTVYHSMAGRNANYRKP